MKTIAVSLISVCGMWLVSIRDPHSIQPSDDSHLSSMTSDTHMCLRDLGRGLTIWKWDSNPSHNFFSGLAHAHNLTPSSPSHILLSKASTEVPPLLSFPCLNRASPSIYMLHLSIHYVVSTRLLRTELPFSWYVCHMKHSCRQSDKQKIRGTDKPYANTASLLPHNTVYIITSKAISLLLSKQFPRS